MKRFEGKVAIVTGGARGIGQETCKRLAAEGAIVYVWDVIESKQTVDLINDLGGKGYEAFVDITDSKMVEENVEKIIKEQGRVDILINNAGVLTNHENLLTVTDEIWEREIAINLTGPFYCSRAVLPYMMAQNYGKIVSVSSIAGNTGRISTGPAYSAAKAGVMGLTRSTARNVAKYGINVNAVCPGWMLTEISKNYPEEVKQRLLSEIPYNRPGTPEDIASAIAFLASDDAAYINGESLCVNGGSFMA